MQDFVGAELSIDDWVVIQRPHLKGFVLGRIKSFTKKRVVISHAELTIFSRGKIYESIIASTNCVKVSAEHVLLKVLSQG